MQRETGNESLPVWPARSDAGLVARTSLPGNLLAPAAGRRFVRDALAEWTGLGFLAGGRCADRLADDAAVVVSELVTNAVVHAGTVAELLCRFEEPAQGEPAALVVEVSDHHPASGVTGGTHSADQSGTPEYGRGLHLVASLAERWGVTFHAALKTVWARLPLDGRDIRPPVAAPPIPSARRGRDGAEPSTRTRAGRDDLEWAGRGAPAFLAEASDLLAGQLDEDMVAALAGQLLVPRLADRCAIWLDGESKGHGGGSGRGGAASRLVGVWHSDESRVGPLREALGEGPPTFPDAPTGAGPVRVVWPDRTSADASADASSADGTGPAGAAVRVERPVRHGLRTVEGGVSAVGGNAPRARASAADAARERGALPDTGEPAADAERGPFLPGAGEPACPSEQGADAATALAYPLSAGGRRFGVLLVAQNGREHVAADVAALVEDFARRVALAVGAARRYARQATISRVLQRGLLPSRVGQIPGVDTYLVYEPSDDGVAGGDFYDVFPAGSGGRWCFMLGDVQGSGPEAAVVTGLARPWLRLLAREGYEVGQVLDRLNGLLLDDAMEAAEATALLVTGGHGPVPPEGQHSRFLSLLYGEVVPSPGGDGGARCTLASAGHPLPLLLRPDGTVRVHAEPQVLLGVVDDVAYRSHTFDLEPGDTLLCVTDGVTERRSGSRMFDDEDGLAAALSECAGLTAQGVAERIRAAVHAFGPPPGDDLALLVLQAGWPCE
ncbi:SpoIIE family protein phosphatase [Streptomyces peucetius]|uniref:SpoIIE family protein phosphatase n=1 Tax=Streptomyces peucetius TaxID=1950 RepID=A0ABY6IHU9_STRPE|nr:SpoIIE family protein phosphatase [Streptomyces peucetius]UYQ66471.1 SpoIIE family protein phosphatase [Streptomyces peucetius]